MEAVGIEPTSEEQSSKPTTSLVSLFILVFRLANRQAPEHQLDKISLKPLKLQLKLFGLVVAYSQINRQIQDRRAD